MDYAYILNSAFNQEKNKKITKIHLQVSITVIEKE
jgi:hypothetical protein